MQSLHLWEKILKKNFLHISKKFLSIEYVCVCVHIYIYICICMYEAVGRWEITRGQLLGFKAYQPM